jgi:6-phosphogluconolactonase
VSTDAPQIYTDGAALARAAADELARIAQESVAARGIFTVALAGGSTPKRLYSLLANDAPYRQLPWAQMNFFFGDERHVPPDDKDSNYLMAKETLFSSGLIPEENIHRIKAEMPDAHAAAAEYETQLKAFFEVPMRLDGFPRFDLVLLGMGPDGHTASLFPGSPGLEEKTRWVIANPVEKFKTDRITLTFPVLNAARTIHLLVGGADKADKIAEVLNPKPSAATYPVQRVAPKDGVLVWMLDEAAAAKLSPRS